MSMSLEEFEKALVKIELGLLHLEHVPDAVFYNAQAPELLLTSPEAGRLAKHLLTLLRLIAQRKLHTGELVVLMLRNGGASSLIKVPQQPTSKGAQHG